MSAVAASEEPTSTDRAVEFIREAIIDGSFPAESMLSEGELAAQLGVSRTPVRVALARLQDEGWVRIYAKRGALVQGLSAEELEDIAHARVVLETSGVTRASSQARTRLALELAPLVQEQRAALAARDVRRFIDLTQRLHGAFLHVGGNRYLLELGERLADWQRRALFANQHTLLDRSDHIIDEHEELLDCLRADDPVRFGDVLRDHVRDSAGRQNGLV